MLFECMDGEEAREHTERTGGEQNHGSWLRQEPTARCQEVGLGGRMEFWL